MILKYAIALAILIILAAAFTWAFLPARYLPGNRARHLRIRLHLRLHPGKGFAHAFSLWLRWGRLAALRRSSRIRPALPLWYRIAEPRQHSVFLGRAHYRHRLHVPLEEHLLVMAPPRTYKTAFLADVILSYPGPVIATSTKPDLYDADQPSARPARPGARVQPAAHRRRPLHVLLVPGQRMRGPGHRHPPRRRVRVRRLGQGRRGRHVLVRQSQRLPARLLPRRRPGPVRPAHRRRLGIRRRPGRPRADPARRRRPPMGPHPGRTPVRSAQDRRHRPHGHVPGPGLHGRPRPGRLGPAATRRRVRHPRLPRRPRHRLPDRRSHLRRSPGRPAVRRHGRRDPLHRRPARAGVGVGPAGPDPPDGPGRGDPDLPGPAAVLAGRLRRQGHPSGRRRARRSPARRTLGRLRPAGRPGHLLGQGVPARHHRHHHPPDRQHLVRASVVETPRPGPRQPPRRGHPGHDPPAARRVRPDHPRRLRPGHRPPAPRLAQPRLPPRPPPRPGPRELAAEADWPEPDIPDYVPAQWIPGDGTSFPWS